MFVSGPEDGPDETRSWMSALIPHTRLFSLVSENVTALVPLQRAELPVLHHKAAASTGHMSPSKTKTISSLQLCPHKLSLSLSFCPSETDLAGGKQCGIFRFQNLRSRCGQTANIWSVKRERKTESE